MTPRLHVAIVGYGTAGQTAAILLARDGHRVEVFEQAPEPRPVGAGFLLQPTGLQVLWSMGLLAPVLAHGAPVTRLYGETVAGRGVMDMRYQGLGAGFVGLGMQRGALFELLDQAWAGQGQLHAGSRIVHVDPDAGRIRDEAGRGHGPFDLVIAADGAGSRLRGHLAPESAAKPYPWGALWCLLPAAGWQWTDELRQRYVAARKMIGMLPVGTRPGDGVPRLSFFWSLRSDGFEDWARAGRDAFLAEVASIWPEAEAQLGSGFDTATLARATYRDSNLSRWHRDRMVLLGDAAHAMSPQLGQGVNMALMDALALRDALRNADNMRAALAEYEDQRRRHVGIYQFWSRWLTPVFQSDHDWLGRLRDLAFLPLGSLPGGRGHMLRVLSGTQQGALGKRALEAEFLAACAQAVSRRS